MICKYQNNNTLELYFITISHSYLQASDILCINLKQYDIKPRNSLIYSIVMFINTKTEQHFQGGKSDNFSSFARCYKCYKILIINNR